MPRLILYSTSHCALCEQALDLLLNTPEVAGMQLDVVDVATDDDLINVYGARIPVLRLGSAELDAPFGAQALAEFLAPFVTS